MNDVLSQRSAIVGDAYDADVYFYSGAIDQTGFAGIINALSEGRAKTNGMLILTTNGGSLNTAYQMTRFLQRKYEKLFVFPPGQCRSAGTLITLGAHRLFMDEHSELGPLNGVFSSVNDDFGRKDGVDMGHALESLSEGCRDLFKKLVSTIAMVDQSTPKCQFATQVSATIAAQVYAPLFWKIDPTQLSMKIGYGKAVAEYGRRLAEKSRNVKPGSIDRLINDYPVHDFIIDREEAADLFSVIETPTEKLYALVDCLGDAAFTQASTTSVRKLARVDQS